MPEPDPLRTPAEPARFELRCPACAQPLFVPPLEAAVNLTACPQPSCRIVSVVCSQPWALGLGNEQVVSLDRFVHGDANGWSYVAGVALTFGFLSLPVAMLAAVESASIHQQICGIFFAGPALVIGLVIAPLSIFDAARAWLEHRRTTRARRRVLPRARWLPARTHPGW